MYDSDTVATQLQQILALTDVGVGAIVVLNHNLNVSLVPVIPDEVAFDTGNFTFISATSTTITVQNTSGAIASGNVRITRFHSILREFGADQTVFLTPRPFVIAGGGGGSSSTSQVFRYTISQPADGSDFFVTLPVAMASDSYSVFPSLAGGETLVAFECPDIDAGDRTTTQFRVITSADLADGDLIDFNVIERS